jgi:hypothetical protein
MRIFKIIMLIAIIGILITAFLTSNPTLQIGLSLMAAGISGLMWVYTKK